MRQPAPQNRGSPVTTAGLDQKFMQTLDAFVRERLAPLEEHVADAGSVPPEVIQEMRNLGATQVQQVVIARDMIATGAVA